MLIQYPKTYIVCHMLSTTPEKYSQVKCAGLCLVLCVCFNTFTGFPWLLLCTACGHKLLLHMSCFSSESLVLLQPWRFSGSRFVIFSIVTPKSCFSVQMFYPGRHRRFQKFSKFICQSCKIVLWQSGVTWRCPISCACPDQ